MCVVDIVQGSERISLDISWELSLIYYVVITSISLSVFLMYLKYKKSGGLLDVIKYIMVNKFLFFILIFFFFFALNIGVLIGCYFIISNGGFSSIIYLLEDFGLLEQGVLFIAIDLFVSLFIFLFYKKKSSELKPIFIIKLMCLIGVSFLMIVDLMIGKIWPYEFFNYSAEGIFSVNPFGLPFLKIAYENDFSGC